MSNEVNDALQSEVADLRDFAEGLERRLAMFGETKSESAPVFRSGGEFLKALAAGSEEARDFGTTVEADVTRPGWVNERLARKVENRRVLNLFGKGALPASGNSIEYPYIKTDTGTVAQQVLEGDALSYMEVALDTATAPVKTYGGYISLSRQSIERSDLAYLETSIDLMVQQYAKATDDAVRAALVAAKGVRDHDLGTTENATKWIDLVVDAAAAIEDNTVNGTADFMIVSRDVFKRLAHMVDTTGRPVFNLFGAGTNNIGSADVVGATLNVAGLETVVDGRLAANSAYVCSRDAIKTFESPGAPFRLTDENIINLTKDFSLYGYMAIAVVDADGIRRLDVDLVV